MIKFSKKVEYGLTAILHLDFLPDAARVNTRELSRAYAIPEEHLGKVLQKMVKANLLASTKGPRGGYCLVRGPAEIRLGELVEALDGPIPTAHQGEHALSTEFSSCYVKGGLHEIQHFMRACMQGVTLEQAMLHNRELLDKLKAVS